MIAVYPRLDAVEAEARLRQIRDASARRGAESESARIARVSALHSTALTHASWPHYGERVDHAVVKSFRERIVAVASEHGFPATEYGSTKSEQSDRARRQQGFDEALAASIVDLLPGLTFAEASKMEVWRFLSLVAVPDVVAWRWPISPESKQGTLDRFVHPRRHMLRWAWRRAVMIGPDLDSELLEDEREGILGRPEIVQSPEIARALTKALISLPRRKVEGITVRDTYREGLKRALRASGRFHLGVLDSTQLAAVMHAAVLDREFIAEDAMAKFARRCEDSGIDVAPLLRIDLPTDDGVSRLIREVEQHRRKFEHDPTATRAAKQLSALLAEWQRQSRALRQVVLAAAIYFLQQQDARDDSSEGGFEDDLLVAVHAADVIAEASADRSHG